MQLPQVNSHEFYSRLLPVDLACCPSNKEIDKTWTSPRWRFDTRRTQGRRLRAGINDRGAGASLRWLLPYSSDFNPIEGLREVQGLTAQSRTNVKTIATLRGTMQSDRSCRPVINFQYCAGC
jgi:hypothetical protein